MKIYIGADHRGFYLKNSFVEFLKNAGHEVRDLGDAVENSADDYTDFAAAVGKHVSKEPDTRGIVICGSGAGVAIVANKFRGVRAVLGFSAAQVLDARRDDDVNVLALASDFTSAVEAEEIVQKFLETPFLGEERHVRRLKKIDALENT